MHRDSYYRASQNKAQIASEINLFKWLISGDFITYLRFRISWQSGNLQNAFVNLREPELSYNFCKSSRNNATG